MCRYDCMLCFVLSSEYRYAFTGLVFEIWHLFKNCEVYVVANILQENLFFKSYFKLNTCHHTCNFKTATIMWQ